MHSLELKSELRDPALARSICRAIGATQVASLDQTDTYFRIPAGRFKKRETPGEPPEYIFYDRADRAQPRLSHFTILSEDEARTRFGTTPIPVSLVVRKQREVWMLGNVRIHLDVVRGLGHFLEFEALISSSHTVARCHEEVTRLRAAFAPALGEPIGTGYADLLAAEHDGAKAT